MIRLVESTALPGPEFGDDAHRAVRIVLRLRRAGDARYAQAQRCDQDEAPSAHGFTPP